MRDFGLDKIVPVVVAIDCHRGHLDPEVATMSAPADVAARLVESSCVFLNKCRAAGV